MARIVINPGDLQATARVLFDAERELAGIAGAVRNRRLPATPAPVAASVHAAAQRVAANLLQGGQLGREARQLETSARIAAQGTSWSPRFLGRASDFADVFAEAFASAAVAFLSRVVPVRNLASLIRRAPRRSAFGNVPWLQNVKSIRWVKTISPLNHWSKVLRWGSVLSAVSGGWESWKANANLSGWQRLARTGGNALVTVAVAGALTAVAVGVVATIGFTAPVALGVGLVVAGGVNLGTSGWQRTAGNWIGDQGHKVGGWIGDRVASGVGSLRRSGDNVVREIKQIVPRLRLRRPKLDW
jgi:hypothetical protein